MSAKDLAGRFAERSALLRTRKRQYVIVLQLGVVAALVLSITAFRININPDEVSDLQLSRQEIVQIEEIVQTRQIEKPPPPPRPPVPVEVPNDVELAQEDLNFDATLDLDAALTEPPPPPSAVTSAEAEPEPEIFVVVEQPPEMIGGMPALLEDLEYPTLARRASLEGRVVVRIVVNLDGSPSDPSILRSVSEVLDKEAIRAVMLQKFKPGRQRGRPVRVYMAIPVVFALN
jgi:protein TonB